MASVATIWGLAVSACLMGALVTWRSQRWLQWLLVVMVSGVWAAGAHAACNVSTGSTTGATVTISGTGGSNKVGLCVSNDTVLWGLYGATNGANPNVDAFNNLPMTAGGLSYSNLNYSSSKATYTIVPVDSGDPSQTIEYDITLNTQSGSGSDTITVWYASACSRTNQCNFVSQNTDTSFTITVNLPGPSVTSVSPTSGPLAGGTSVVITGTNFTGATAVAFGGTAAASFTVNSATQITATAPAGTGTVDVRVTTPIGTSATSAADQYTYVAAPTVTSISPTAGPTGGGTSVVITGTNFTGATAVSFGATAATGFTVNSATQITATAPAGSTGTVDVRVTTIGGTSATSAADQYTYVAAPTITSISPTAGPTGGGTSVTITGTNFTGATAVTFGATAVTGFTINSATQITATAPAGTGTVDVRVTTVGGTSATSASDQFTYVVRQTGAITTAVGGGTVSAQIVSGSASCAIDTTNTVAFTPPLFDGGVAPYGGLKIRLTGCTAGETVRVAVTWPDLAGRTARKYGKTPTSSGATVWYTPNNMVIAGNTVSYDITDNGLGDDTFTGADGIINDPVVPLILSSAQGIPTLSNWALAVLAGLMLFGFWGVRRARWV